MQIRYLLRSLREALKDFFADSVPRMGAELAYYTLFSIAPVLLIVIAVAGALFGPAAVRGEIVGDLDQLMAPEAARAVQFMLEAAREPRDGLVASVAGVVGVVVGATGLFLHLQLALNAIWRVRRRPGTGVKALLRNRLRSLAVVVSIGVLQVASLLASVALAALGGWVERRVSGLSALLQVFNVLVSLGISTALFALLLRFLPDVRLSWRDVGIGASITALLFVIGRQLIAVYLGRSGLQSTYGAAWSGVALLLWVYYSSQVVLLGAEITRVLTHRERGAPELEPYAMQDPDAPRRIAAA
jgi:membrane protein